ncbi:MAG: Serine phosphatase RsbU, regulator of sigma subunit [uncultured Chloroflexia bacterium]|uniref:Serine phosphatase RsbU, regulator of sigma subunit n=1 Tax=uncultured Chloroflexia bacterium TaxID=1672391 RepID=A0A6J4MBP2_9CHLR|nr:MAG: Serine phosphatase RsbU, regulator of sigma subunit [uncultured Chloroflexia bacterium]
MNAEPLISIGAENERLRAELARQQRNIRLLRDIALASRGVADPNEVFETIYQRLKEEIPVDAFFVALCDHPDSQRYHFALFVDSGMRSDVRANFADDRVGGLAGWILGLKESRMFRDLHAERTDTVPVPQQFGDTTRRSRAWMGVPLMIGRESVGVISVQSYEYGVYDEGDLELVEALADLAAITLENAILYRSQDELGKSLATRVAARSEELAVLTSIASGLSRGQYDEARLMEALERILWMLSLEAGAIWLNDGPTGLRHVVDYAVAGSNIPLKWLHRSESIEPDVVTQFALAQNRPIMRSEAQPFPRFDDTMNPPTVSVFAEPLRAHGRVVGVLTLYGAPGRSLEAAEESLLEAASQQMAIGVDNARLYREARDIAATAEQRADNLALVHRISRLVSSSLDLTEVVRTTAEQMVQLFGVDHCAFMLFDDAGVRGEIVAEYPALGTVGYRTPFIPGDYLEEQPGQGELSFVTDLNDPRFRSVRPLAEKLGVQASLLIPVISRGRSIGAIGLNLFGSTRPFSDEDNELCRTIAAQVAIAIENARLYQVTRSRVEQEMEIARSIQANLFPRSLPTIGGAQLAGRCLPALETGGDFYDVLPLGGNRFGFSIGDVSGKSLPAAMLMAVARSIVRSEALDHADPERVVTETNRLVVQDVPVNTFVSLCYAIYEADSYRLVLANAGHITPFVRHRDGQVEPLKAVSNLPLGIVPDLHYEASAFRLARGDSVLFLTDGLVEAFRPEDGEMFGFDRLTDLFGARGDLPAENVVDQLLDTVCEWQGNENRNDDMTAIVLQVQ